MFVSAEEVSCGCTSESSYSNLKVSHMKTSAVLNNLIKFTQSSVLGRFHTCFIITDVT